jgi:NRAMP (natural resistance-associated macrophage protein)-like metal ion transporter
MPKTAQPQESNVSAEALLGEANPIKRILKALGPGFITGASDDDPSGVGTYAMAGAALGYSMLWTALFTFPLMAGVQFTCAKLGMVTGRGIAGVLREHYSRQVLYPAVFALVLANTINAGADLGAIAAAINLLIPVRAGVLIVPIGAMILAVQIWGSYRLIASTFRWLTLALFGYIGAALLARPDWGQVLRNTLLPNFVFSAHSMAVLVAILGTTISPYLFFWQANQEVEEQVEMGRKRLWQRKGATDTELHYRAWDVNLGMTFSNAVMYFIILATAATLFKAGKTDIQTASQAAQALRPLAGNMAEALLALGLIGSGVLAVPILTGSSAYAVAEAFGWKRGLAQRAGRAKEFYSFIAASTVIGILINYIGVSPIRALFWTAILNGFLAPPLLVVILVAANDRRIMGQRANGWKLNVLGWATAILMFAAAIGLVVTAGN